MSQHPFLPVYLYTKRTVINVLIRYYYIAVSEKATSEMLIQLRQRSKTCYCF